MKPKGMLPCVALALAAGLVCVPDQQGWTQAPTQRTTFQAHAGAVYAVAFSPDGKILATAGHDKLVKLWDVARHRELAILNGHESSVLSLSFSPDGRSLVSASYDKSVRLWEVATGKERFQCRGHQEGVRCVAFAPDGKTLLSGGDDGKLKAWDAATGKELLSPYTLQIKADTDAIHRILFSPDGKLLAVAAGSEVFLWDTVTGEMRVVLDGPRTVGFAMAFSPDSKALATSYCDVAVWDLATGKPHILEAIPLRALALSLAFSPSGKTLVAGPRSGRNPGIYLWNMKKGTEWLGFDGHRAWIHAVAFSPNGKLLVSGSTDGALIFWNAAGL